MKTNSLSNKTSHLVDTRFQLRLPSFPHEPHQVFAWPPCNSWVVTTWFFKWLPPYSSSPILNQVFSKYISWTLIFKNSMDLSRTIKGYAHSDSVFLLKYSIMALRVSTSLRYLCLSDSASQFQRDWCVTAASIVYKQITWPGMKPDGSYLMTSVS